MTCPKEYVLLKYNLFFFLSTITAARSAHHCIDTLTAFRKTDRLWNSLLWPIVRSATVSVALCLNSYTQGQAVSTVYNDWLTDWLTDRLTE